MVNAQAFRKEIFGEFETYYERFQAGELPEGSEVETIDVEAGEGNISQ